MNPYAEWDRKWSVIRRELDGYINRCLEAGKLLDDSNDPYRRMRYSFRATIEMIRSRIEQIEILRTELQIEEADAAVRSLRGLMFLLERTP